MMTEICCWGGKEENMRSELVFKLATARSFYMRFAQGMGSAFYHPEAPESTLAPNHAVIAMRSAIMTTTLELSSQKELWFFFRVFACKECSSMNLPHPGTFAFTAKEAEHHSSIKGMFRLISRR
jgi:hypothetical protein